MYSHLCIQVSMHLYSYEINTRYIWTGCTWLRAILGTPEDDDGGKSEMHLEAMIEQVWRCTGWSRSSDLGDALGGHK